MKIKGASRRPSVEVDRISLFKRYIQLVQVTMLSFLLSTFIHVGSVVGYYGIFLWLNPSDPGRKAFYSSTTTTKGVNIGGKIVGGGGVQTNHHKSYYFHLVKEYYKNISYIFYVQFSLIYLIMLVLFKFFPEREKLRVDPVAALNMNSVFDTEQRAITKAKSPKLKSNKLSRRSILTKRIKKYNEIEENDEVEEEYIAEDLDDTNEEIQEVNNQGDMINESVNHELNPQNEVTKESLEQVDLNTKKEN